jgi:hypothetical protein
MIRINLLPHREQKKAAHRLRFQLLLGSAFGAALLIVGLSYFILDTRESPGRAQPVPASEIAKLDQQIKDIGALKKQRDDLLARKQLVERLQQGVMMPYTFSTSWYARPGWHLSEGLQAKRQQLQLHRLWPVRCPRVQLHAHPGAVLGVHRTAAD